MNYQPEEIEKFDSFAQEWWDEKGPLQTLHQVNPIRIKFILDNLKSTNLNNLNVLDVGCGGGILSEALAHLNAKVSGIDLSSQAIAAAKVHASKSNFTHPLDYNVISIEDFAGNPQNCQKFDVITCMELLEHVPDPSAIIYNIKKLLKPGGTVFLSTLNKNLKSYVLSIVFAEYILNWIPRGTHEYNKFIKPSYMAQMLRDNDLNITNLLGITYSIFNNKFVATKNTDVNYMACAS